jgi:hypothetical protein
MSVVSSPQQSKVENYDAVKGSIDHGEIRLRDSPSPEMISEEHRTEQLDDVVEIGEGLSRNIPVTAVSVEMTPITTPG